MKAKEARTNGPPTQEVLTLTEAATYLRLSVKDLRRLAVQQAVPARQVGKEWRFLKSALDQWLWGGVPVARNGTVLTKDESKKRLLALAGTWKDDPIVDYLQEKIWRERGQPIPKDD